MNKSEYKTALSQIQPSDDFVERTLAYLKRDKLEKSRKARPHLNVHKCAYVGIAIVACMIATILVLPNLFDLSKIKETQQTKPVQTVNTSISEQILPIETSQNNSEQEQLILDGSPVLFSSLKFPDSDPIFWPKNIPTNSTASIEMPVNYALQWSESADLIVKVTVLNVRFNQYPVKFKVKKEDYKVFLTDEENQYRMETFHTIVLEVRIDKVYHAGSTNQIKAGDILTIENSLMYIDFNEPEVGLKTSHQYILSVKQGNGELVYPAERLLYDAVIGNTTSESKFFMLFTLTPQIELTLNGGYLFYASKGSGWIDLINDRTVKVVMDGNTNTLNMDYHNDWLYRNNMFLRADNAFELDFQALVDKYFG